MLVVVLLPDTVLQWAVALGSLVFLALLGVLAARTGDAPMGRSVLRVGLWGALAMAATWLVGVLLGVAA